MRLCLFNASSIALIWLFAASHAGAQSDVWSPGGALVSLGPPEAVALGAAWRIDGGPFRASGASDSGLSPGHHLLQFGSIPGWAEPAEQEVLIAGGAVRALDFEYAPLPVFYFRTIPFQTAL